jgi:hypothetical protein
MNYDLEILGDCRTWGLLVSFRYAVEVRRSLIGHPCRKSTEVRSDFWLLDQYQTESPKGMDDEYFR